MPEHDCAYCVRQAEANSYAAACIEDDLRAALEGRALPPDGSGLVARLARQRDDALRALRLVCYDPPDCSACRETCTAQETLDALAGLLGGSTPDRCAAKRMRRAYALVGGELVVSLIVGAGVRAEPEVTP